ncbi:hypothetical protein HGM15179_015910, partial [Zosterops borbonicus]
SQISVEIYTYDPSKTCKPLPSFCGVTTARQANCNAKPRSRTQETPHTFMF